MVLSTPLKTFHKFCGAGNDFVLIDDRHLTFPTQDKELIKRLCHRNLGIGADGVILVQPSQECDFRFRIFNADASEAEMCGNGVRCFAKFLAVLEYTQSSFTLETMERKLVVERVGDEISVHMGDPTDIQWNCDSSLHHINTGVPHAVFFVEALETLDIKTEGPKLRYHPLFQPKGANANFIQINNNEVFIRTYERGVEGETLACGTGATASALVAAHTHSLKSPVKVHTFSGDILTISFDYKNGAFTNVRLQGPAHLTFSGTISY